MTQDFCGLGHSPDADHISRDDNPYCLFAVTEASSLILTHFSVFTTISFFFFWAQWDAGYRLLAQILNDSDPFLSHQCSNLITVGVLLLFNH